MRRTEWKLVFVPMMVVILLGVGSTAQAQVTQVNINATSPSPWSVDIGFGLDNSISGNINSSAVGRLNNQAVVILKNQYEDVYGTGLHFRFGGGYMLNDASEVRVTFTLQSLDADLVRLGDIGSSNLYGQYADYQSFGIDLGFRQYVDVSGQVRAYGEATLGLGFVDETDVVLVAPAFNLGGNATDFYDKTTAFTLGGNVGVLVPVAEKVGIFGQMGLRYVTGMSEVDSFAGTGLETINDSSARWTFPIVVGIRATF